MQFKFVLAPLKNFQKIMNLYQKRILCISLTSYCLARSFKVVTFWNKSTKKNKKTKQNRESYPILLLYYIEIQSG